MNTLYSNFDHKLNKESADWLINNPGKELEHTAWNFCSYVRYENNKFKATVMRHHNVVAEIEDDDLIKLISETNNKFGAD